MSDDRRAAPDDESGPGEPRWHPDATAEPGGSPGSSMASGWSRPGPRDPGPTWSAPGGDAGRPAPPTGPGAGPSAPGEAAYRTGAGPGAAVPPPPPGPAPRPYGATTYPGGGDPFAGPRRPGIVPLAPLSVGDILGGAFAALRFNPLTLIGVSLAFYLVVAVLSLGVNYGQLTSAGAETNPVSWTDLVSGALTVVLAGFLVIPVVAAVRGEKLSVGRTWRTLRPAIWRLIGTSLLVGLIMAVLATPAIALAFVVAAAADGGATGGLVLAVLGLLAWAVLLLFLLVWFAFATPAAVVEGLRPVAAVRRSLRLVRRAYWRTLWVQFLAGLIATVVALALSTPLVLLLTGIIVVGVGAGAEESGGTLLAVAAVTALAIAVVQGLTQSFSAAVTSLLYVDRRFRTEGYALAVADARADRDPQDTVPVSPDAGRDR